MKCVIPFCLTILCIVAINATTTKKINHKENQTTEHILRDAASQPKKVLIFAPHPDDDIIGCGGSIAKHVKNGHDVAIVYMTSGDAGSMQYSKKELAHIREEEATNAAHILGVKKLFFLRNPDGYLNYDEKNLVQLTRLIREEQPDIVYIPHRGDSHSDHVMTYDLIIQATKRACGTSFQECGVTPWNVKTILCYEVWTPLQSISYFEDISQFMELKLQALRQHASQISRLRYDHAVDGLNQYRGIMSRTSKYCEGFQIFKISNNDLAQLIMV